MSNAFTTHHILTLDQEPFKLISVALDNPSIFSLQSNTDVHCKLGSSNKCTNNKCSLENVMLAFHLITQTA